MKPKVLYAILCVAGAVLPLSQLVPFLRDNGLDLRLFVEQLFATRIGAFFGWDVIVSSVVLWVFVLVDGRRAGVRNLWAPIAANLAIGVSLGLPLFLYMRERRLETHRGAEGPGANDASDGSRTLRTGERLRGSR